MSTLQRLSSQIKLSPAEVHTQSALQQSSEEKLTLNLDSRSAVYAAAQEKELMKKIALFISLLNLLVSIYMWFQFDYNTTSYQFVYEFNNLSFCHFHVGVDGLSLYFVLLTTFITPICILSN